MPLFKKESEKLTLQKPTNFKSEKELQNIVEKNLGEIFDCRFVGSEFSTGAEHAGRIDTVALSEDNNPVIIEYKKKQSSQLITQALYYLNWLHNHKGDFKVAVEKKLSERNADIDWEEIRVICIAPGYDKFDLYAVKEIGRNIELWQYHLYEDDSIYLEEISRKKGLPNNQVSDPKTFPAINIKLPKPSYTFEQHLDHAESNIKTLLRKLQEFIINISESITERPRKFYIAYATSKNFACLVVKKEKIRIYLKLNPKKIDIPGVRDVTKVGHYVRWAFATTTNLLALPLQLLP